MTVLLGVHALGGLVAVIGGVVAMLTRKGGPAHRRGGRAWLGGLAVLCATAPPLVARDWAHLWYLLVLAGVAAGSALVGYLGIRSGRRVVHILGMGSAFMVMLTAFYVDNGPRLPGWSLLPPVAFWLLPAAVGLPIMLRAVRKVRR